MFSLYVSLVNAVQIVGKETHILSRADLQYICGTLYSVVAWCLVLQLMNAAGNLPNTAGANVMRAAFARPTTWFDPFENPEGITWDWNHIRAR
jgi:hypothetical protein